MDPETLDAYGVMAATLALRVTELMRLAPSPAAPAEPGPIFYHLSMSDWEDCAACLWSLKIFRPLDPTPDGRWACHFKLDCDLKDAESIARRNVDTGPSFDCLLTSFVSMTADYGPPIWVDEPRVKGELILDARALPAIRALEKLGYIESSPGSYRWTEKVRPVMESIYFWLPGEGTKT